MQTRLENAVYSDGFAPIGAHEMAVAGLPQGCAGTSLTGGRALTTLAALFTVGTDVAAMSMRKLMPARPAPQCDVLAAGD